MRVLMLACLTAGVSGVALTQELEFPPAAVAVGGWSPAAPQPAARLGTAARSAASSDSRS